MDVKRAEGSDPVPARDPADEDGGQGGGGEERDWEGEGEEEEENGVGEVGI